MKLLIESTGKRVRIAGTEAEGTIYQGLSEDDVPVLVVAVVVTPLIAPEDPRQAAFEDGLRDHLDVTMHHPEVELFPGEITL